MTILCPVFACKEGLIFSFDTKPVCPVTKNTMEGGLKEGMNIKGKSIIRQYWCLASQWVTAEDLHRNGFPIIYCLLFEKRDSNTFNPLSLIFFSSSIGLTEKLFRKLTRKQFFLL